MVTKLTTTGRFTLMNETHKQWIRQATGGDSIREIGRNTGISHAAIVRSLNRNGLSTDQVVRIAHAYGVDITEALQDTGILPKGEEEARGPREIAEAIKRLADQLADQAAPNNVTSLFDKTTPESDPADYDLGTVAYSDDEDAARGWEYDD